MLVTIGEEIVTVRNSWRASMATPAFIIHGICNPITRNVGLHTGANWLVISYHHPQIIYIGQQQ